ncbi:MAG: fatty acid desaturase CarF family protein [Pirellula sp.]|jgi:ubiquitin-conjugating enzyme E2 variant
MPREEMQPELQHQGGNWITFWFEALCIIGSLILILVHCWSIWQQRDLWSPWLVLSVIMAWPAADLVSGLVHWTADTWGSEEFPILGPRFIRPFRVHHTTPTSFLKCNFLDTNGDTCLISIPVLLCFYWIPVHSTAGVFALTFGVAFCIFAIPTNQIHQWAHMPQPPRWIQILQKTGLILTKEEHARHHKLPYSGHYCITNGFCNRWLEAFGFFRFLEKIITSLTGVPPRLEETRQFNDRKK